jgi:hypothetical protein
MTIEIRRPEVAALIEQRLRTGGFTDAEEVIFDALRSSATQATGAELVAAMQASPYKDIEIEPSRDRLPVRDAAL